MGGVAIFLLSGGIIDADRSVIHPGDDSHKRVTLPCFQILLRSEGQTVLVDTGMPPSAAGDPDGLRREYDIDPSWIRPVVTPEEQIDTQLAALGLKLPDLDLVVNTHFHFDHAGGNALCSGVPVAAQRAEFEAARESDYLPVWDAAGLEFRSIEGDWSPLPGVEMLVTPGHTPGHQSMLVRLDDRPWLFTCDAVYTEEHWRAGKLGAVSDIAQARTSIERLHRVAAEEDARIIFGHDIAQWESLGMTRGGGPKQVA